MIVLCELLLKIINIKKRGIMPPNLWKCNQDQNIKQSFRKQFAMQKEKRKILLGQLVDCFFRVPNSHVKTFVVLHLQYMCKKRKFAILQSLCYFLGTSLCGLTAEERRVPKFYRVSESDLPHFPSKTFSSLALLEGENLSTSLLNKKGLFQPRPLRR